MLAATGEFERASRLVERAGRLCADIEGLSEARQALTVERVLYFDAVPNPYGVLGVAGREQAELKRRYRRLSLQVHPDKCSNPQAEAAFKAVKRCFDWLMDPNVCLLYTSPSPRDQRGSRMPSSA